MLIRELPSRLDESLMPDTFVIGLIVGSLATLGLEHWVFPLLAHRWNQFNQRHVGRA